MKSQLELLKIPAVFVEGKHDKQLFSTVFSRLKIYDTMEFRVLGGTPNKPKNFLNSLIGEQNWNSDQPTVILLDNDKAGRATYRMLCGGTPKEAPEKVTGNIFVWSLPTTNDFEEFVSDFQIERNLMMFTAEMLFPVCQSALLCKELVEELSNSQDVKALNTINGVYWDGLGQEKCRNLLSAEIGSRDWFFLEVFPIT